MTQTLRRERKQKFYSLLVEVKAIPLMSEYEDIKEWRMDLAGQLADAATSTGERRTDEEFGEYKVKSGIFAIYEQNIGALTPILSEELADIEKRFPQDGWFLEATKEAVKMNKRNLKYIVAILERWSNEGRGDNRKKAEEVTPKPIEKKEFPRFVNGKAVFDA